MAFELFQSEKTKKYHFRLKANNHQIILTGEAYEKKAGAKNGIKSVAKNAAANNFEKRTAKNGTQYFVLKARNGEIIGKSQMYKSTSGLNKGIRSVIANTKAVEVKDLT